MKKLEEFNYENLKGKKLKKAMVHYVEPEFNMLLLEFYDGTILKFHGLEGSECIGIGISNYTRIHELEENLIEYYPFLIFYNKEFNGMRILGEKWNGHGVEISFSEQMEKTMLIQSIYTGDLPERFDDCIRLGVGTYRYTFNENITYESIAHEINSWDPIDLLPYAPDNEYEDEIQEIYIGSRTITDEYDLAKLIYKVFIRCFGTDTFTRSKLNCLEIAIKIIS
ncbi:MAG: hypothetical protein FH761_11295 [Firmicutes bacterium]|nr:hypothetical protein [Bacillota bacterium]